MNILPSLLRFALLPALLTASTRAAEDAPPYTQRTNIVYGEVHGTGLLMDIFVPSGTTNGLGIVDVVSGAWHSDRGKLRDHAMAGVYRVLCGHGYTVFAVRPGSVTRYTASEMAQHVRTGIRYVKEHAAEYRVDPARLGLTGASAGGHLATLVAVAPEAGRSDPRNAMARHDTRVRAVAVFFPPTDFLDWDGRLAPMEILGRLLFLGGPTGQSEEDIRERAAAVSPARQVREASVPFLLFHGDADPLVPLQQSRRLVDAIKAAGGSAELIVKPGGGHPWLTIPEEVEVMARWFDERLAGEPAAGRSGAPADGPR